MKQNVYLIGNAHLDLAWLWQWQEGFAEIKATFRSALDRMNEFPEYIFTAGGASYYKWVEENEPAMFEEIKQRIAEGRWVLSGGWWVQPDCNIPCGESFARHGLYGQRYYLEKFGKMATFGYNVDSFGHCQSLPQILAKSRMNGYVMMRPNQSEKAMNDDTFWWEGIDGTRILTYRIPQSYCTSVTNDNLLQRYDQFCESAQHDQQPKMMFYGIGNHGGGPTFSCLSMLEDCRKADEHLVYGSPADFFQKMKEKTVETVISEDLQHHAIGCYSANSEIKRNNRRSENRLICAEKMMTVANELLGLPYEAQDIRRGWQDVLFNQFHDILCGCCIKDAYDDAREFHGEALKIGATCLNASLQKISWNINTARDKAFVLDRKFSWDSWETDAGGTPIVIFNPNAWEHNAMVTLSKEICGATDEQDLPVAHQRVRAKKTCNEGRDDYVSVVSVQLPPMGYRTIYIFQHKKMENPTSTRQLVAGSAVLKNDWYTLELNPATGGIARLWSKLDQRELLNGASVAEVVEDFQNDTWAHAKNSFDDVVGQFGDAKVRIVNSGPLFMTIQSSSRYGSSTLVQEYTMYRDKPGIDVSARLNWQEPFKILRLTLPINVTAPKATYEIPYGAVTKPTNGMEEAAHGWVDITGTDTMGAVHGVSIATEQCYSYSAKENVMRFIVVRSAGYADHFGIKDDFTEAMDIGVHEFKYSILPHAGALAPHVPTQWAGAANQPPIVVYETYHKGTMPLRESFVSSSASNVVVQVIKHAEDGSGIVVRAYETDGIETPVTIELSFIHQSISCKFAAFEVKTFAIAQGGGITETDLLEMEE